MSILGGALVSTIGGLVDKFIPDKTAAAAAQAELIQLLEKGEIDKALAQIQVNMMEAQHASIFVAGWRPALGWVCVASLLYSVIGWNLLAWLSINAGWTQPPVIELESIIYLLTIMLGVGGGMIAIERFQTARQKSTIKQE